MASQGPRYPGTVANVTGIGTIAWINPTYAIVPSDNNYAYTYLPPTASISNYLKTTNYGFTIPTGAIIEGIVVACEESCTNNPAVSEYVASIVKTDVIKAQNKAISGSGGAFPITKAFISHGSSTDLWGETWTAADINASNFGFALVSKIAASTGRNALVDSIRITVYYSMPAASAGFLLLCI